MEADSSAGDTIKFERLSRAMEINQSRVFSARIFQYTKKVSNIQVYVVNHKGIVLYDSLGKSTGKDFSRWNDVHISLRGGYGVRSTRRDPKDPRSSSIYVAAPIRKNGRIIGALTVIKSKDSVSPFIALAQAKAVMSGLLAVVILVALSILLTVWITRPIYQLRDYVQRLRSDHKLSAPVFSSREVQSLSLAFEELRRELEGKNYVEKYVQTLTHEIKSPLTAIRGASELLQQDLTQEQRDRFIENIDRESERIQHLIDRLLKLSRLENRKELQEVEDIQVQVLLDDILASLEPEALRKEISFDLQLTPDAPPIAGEKFLVRQSLLNIIQNALEFASPGSRILIESHTTDDLLELSVSDSGTGIPPYALERIFERFYSLPRPDTGRKSSGLGLAFAREAAELHGGRLSLENNANPGVTARISFAASRS